MVREAVSFDDFEHFVGHRAAERGPAERGSVRARPEQILIRFPQPKGPDREPATQGLRHGNAVRQKALGTDDALEDALKTLEAPGTEVAALHRVDQEQQAVLVTEFSQAQQVVHPGRRDPSFALDALDQHSHSGR